MLKIKKIDDFKDFREEMDEKILNEGNLMIKRFYNIDKHSYKAGALSTKTKEMLGLVASMALRCDDCINYHLIRCKQEGVRRKEFFEIFNIALLIGGSIVIPHLRKAVKVLDELEVDEDGQ
ncbi:MAG TPA: carboxymuconolactone decarboxylase family protein [Halanaerobiales bacterium]|nr:carboxymuconolactone decarboxylase family protein [Halanaerobiales bacterium]